MSASLRIAVVQGIVAVGSREVVRRSMIAMLNTCVRSKDEVWILRDHYVFRELGRLYICTYESVCALGTVARKHFSSPLVECFREKDAS